MLELGETYQAYRDQAPEETFVHVYTFNSTRKSMSTVINLPNGGFRLFSKGASEIMLSRCTQIVGRDGNTLPFSEDDAKNLIETVIEPMASYGLRTICMGYRDFPADQGFYIYIFFHIINCFLCLRFTAIRKIFDT